jgi:hypothetical protein
MKNMGKCKIILIPLSPEKQTAVSPLKKMPPLTRNEMAETYHQEIIDMYPDYATLLKEIVQHLPDNIVLTNLSRSRTPGFLLRLFEERLKNGRSARI